MNAATLLSADALPWIVVAAIATRFAFHVVRTQHLRAQLAVTQERLADALTRLDRIAGVDRLELQAALAQAELARAVLAREALLADATMHSPQPRKSLELPA